MSESQTKAGNQECFEKLEKLSLSTLLLLLSLLSRLLFDLNRQQVQRAANNIIVIPTPCLLGTWRRRANLDVFVMSTSLFTWKRILKKVSTETLKINKCLLLKIGQVFVERVLGRREVIQKFFVMPTSLFTWKRSSGGLGLHEIHVRSHHLCGSIKGGPSSWANQIVFGLTPTSSMNKLVLLALLGSCLLAVAGNTTI